MKYISTRDSSKEFNFEQVFIKGLADDGGLFIPNSIKKFSEDEINSMNGLSYNDLAKKIILQFIDNFMNEKELTEAVNKSYSVFRKDNVVDLINIGNSKILDPIVTIFKLCVYNLDIEIFLYLMVVLLS